MTQIHWANAISGSFTNASDWKGGVVPGASDAAILDAAGVKLYTVTVSANETVSSIQTAANATLYITGAHDDFTATNGSGAGANAGTISVASGATFTAGGVIDNPGLISLTAQTAETFLAVETSGVTLTGGGLVMLGGSGFYTSYFSGGAVTNIDNTISGKVFGYAARLTNEGGGVIDATGGSIYTFIGTNTIVNNGLIENTGSGERYIGCSILDQSGGGVIFAGDSASIYLGGMLIGGTFTTAGTGFISSRDATFDGATSTVNNKGSVTVRGFESLALKGAINNSGTISLNGGSVSGRGSAQLTIDPGGATLSGGGSVVLNSTGLNIVTGGAAAATLTNIDNTISGAGALGAGSLSLINDAAGVIDGNDSLALILDTGASTVVNAGLIEGTGSGGLTIRNTVVNNSGGGVILAGNGSRVSLQGADLIGGTLESAGSGAIKTYKGGANTLDGTSSALDNKAKVVIQNGTGLAMEGAIVNAGRIELTSSGAATTLTIGSGNATLSGGGQVLLGGNAANTITGASSAATLTNVDNMIAGAGNLGAGSLTLVNEAGGVISGNHATAFVIDTGANSIINAGVIIAKGKGGVTVQSAVNNSGLLEAAGGVLTVNGAVSGTGSGVIYSGALDFASSFSQKVVFQGTTGVLELAQSQSYAGTIAGFSKTGGTSLDLRDIGFVSSTEASFVGTAAGGVLTVTDGTHTAHIALRGDYRASTFTASSDGHGGTIVVDPAAPVAATHRFIAAAAGLGAGGGGSVSVAPEPWRAHPPMLARPGVMVA